MVLKNLKYFIFFIGLLGSSKAYSQRAGEWMDLKVDFPLTKKLTLGTYLASRTTNSNGIQFTLFYTELGLHYNLSKYFDPSLRFRLFAGREEDQHYHPNYMSILDLNFNYPLRALRFDYRARFQSLTKSYFISEYGWVQGQHMRNRFNFSCHIPETSLTPAVSVETFTPLNRFKPDLFHEVRYTAEIKISIKDNQSFTPRLIYIDKLSETETSLIIFQLTYKWVIS